MATCSRCQRRIRFWKKDLFGSLCPECREQNNAAREQVAREREAARRGAFEQSGPFRRIGVGMGRGALFGALGLAIIALTMVAAFSHSPGVRYPFVRLSLGWMLASLAVVAVASLVGWWTRWYFGVLSLVAIGLIGGAVVGAIRGWRKEWEVFT